MRRLISGRAILLPGLPVFLHLLIQSAERLLQLSHLILKAKLDRLILLIVTRALEALLIQLKKGFVHLLLQVHTAFLELPASGHQASLKLIGGLVEVLTLFPTTTLLLGLPLLLLTLLLSSPFLSVKLLLLCLTGCTILFVRRLRCRAIRSVRRLTGGRTIRSG